MTTTAIRIGPGDHGRAMRLADFEHAQVQEGHRYELERGVIVVSDVPNPAHAAQVIAIRRQLMAYDLAHAGRIYGILSGGECKILLADDESERHPDLAVYLTPPPSDDSDVWASWIPEIVVEVVSEESRERDTFTKREEYLRFGVREYWIVDAARSQWLVLRRSRGGWAERVYGPTQTYRPRLLPELEFTCAPVFEAAAAVRRD